MNDSQFFKVEKIEDVTILRVTAPDLQDRLVITELQDAFINYFDENKPKKCVIAFGEIKHVSSETINALLQARDHALGNDGRLKLADISSLMEKVLKIAQLDRLFEIHDSVAEAVAAFREENAG